MDKFDLSYVPVLAVAATLIIAFVNYLNFRLNKTLNIKNHLYTEKLKVYRELTKLLSEMIRLHDKAIDLLDKGAENIETSKALNACSDEINEMGIQIDKLIIEAYLLVPDRMVNFLRDFSEYIGQPVAGSPTLAEDLATLRAADQRIREKAEELIGALREDIGTRRLNTKMTRL
ncbi:hypothetical protein [Pedobacter cryoconitis]|uniref:Uncharacterized protein n=1 Tax=Pedobacter cryoconitis TaxID=188932 RepID=A0A327S146_9SPHI|nr:hypothetical protein [Pedobacter cryoconitis]RAJ22368.1 hypothetical protein LY11_04833 [Pedobacter cryoconitis]